MGNPRREARTVAISLVVLLTMAAGCHIQFASNTDGCEVSCRAQYECTTPGQPGFVPACTVPCLGQFADNQECSDAELALSQCGHDKTCEQLAACQAELDRATAACQPIAVPMDAAVDAPAPPVIGTITASLAQPAIATELRTTNTVLVTVQASGGYAGAVTVTLDVTVGGLPVPGWTIGSPASLTLATNASGVASVEFTIPSDTATLGATLGVHAVGLEQRRSDISGSITVAKRVTIEIPAGTGDVTGVHTGLGPPTLQIRSGTELAFHNNDTFPHPIHGTGGILHEQIGGGQPGATYVQTMTTSDGWDCHAHEDGLISRGVTVVP